MKETFFSLLIRRPIWAATIAILFVLSAAYGVQNLGFRADYRVFFSEDNPKLVAYESVQAIFNKSDNIAILLAPKDGDVFTPRMLNTIREITEEAWQIPYSSRVDSLSNFQHSWSQDDDLTVEDLVPEGAEYSPEMIESIRHIALNEPLLVKKLVSPEGHVSLINVTVQLNGPSLEAEIVAKAKEIQQKYMAANPGLDIRLSGMVTVNNSFAESAVYDNSVLVPVMFLVVLVLMILLLRNFSGTFATLIIVITSIMSAMGLTGWLGIDLSGPSASAPIMILTLAVADCIHVLSSMIYEMRQGSDKRSALLESLKINLQPILLTSITTAIGFMSMNFSDSPPFRDLGNIVAMGVMMACLLSLTLFPALLMVLPIKVKPQSDARPQAMLKLADIVSEKRTLLLPLMSILMVALVTLLPKNELNDNFVEYFDESTTVRQSTDFMQENLSGIILLEVAVDSGKTGGISDPVFLQTLEDFSNWFKDQAQVDHVTTITDTFKRLNKNMHGDDPGFYRLPEDKELAAQYLLLYEMSLPYGLDLNNQLNVSKSSTRIIGTLKNLSSVELLDLEQRVNAWFKQHAPTAKVMVTGPDLMFAHIGQNNIESMLSGTSIALVLISVLIGFALRSVRFAFISLVPNIAPAAMGFGAWYLIDGEVGLGLSMVAGMTLGIVVDYTVHFLSKYLHARRNKQADTDSAVRYAYGNVGNALWITTLVLVAGFSVMAQSTFKLNGDMGFLTAITISIALIVDFFFLPPLLLQVDRKETDDTASVQATNTI